MKISFKIFLSLILIISHGLFCYGQKHFVTFEMTTNSPKICQGKSIGVIARLTPAFEEYKNYKWAGDQDNFSEVKDEIAIVNTSKPGEKRLKFTLILGENQKLDTVFLVNVFPRPEAIVVFLNSNLSFVNSKNENIVSIKWKYNGALLPDVTDSIIENPKKGTYQAFIIDNNGCRATSQVFTVQ